MFVGTRDKALVCIGALKFALGKITDDQNRVVEFGWGDHGELREVYFNHVFDENGVLQNYCYTEYAPDGGLGNSNRGWLGSVTNKWFTKDPNTHQWSGSSLSSNTYTYDNAGNRLTNQVSILNQTTRTEQYGYDELNRLTSVNYGDGGTQSYSFDAMGNRLTKNDSSSGNESYTYNAANMLLTRGSNSYTNDQDGNTLTGGGRTNTWDSQNRLTQCVYNGNTSSYVYGADGLRHRSIVNGVTTDYGLDGQSVVQEGQASNGMLTPTVTYLTGPTGPLYRRDSSGTLRWYLYDGLGSVLGEVDAAGTLQAIRTYDVYGSARTVTGTPTSKHAFVGQLGHPSEDETGLIYMRARYYDPVVGRFASEDLAQSGANWFTYAGGNPVGLVDRSGKSPSKFDFVWFLDHGGWWLLGYVLNYLGLELMSRGKHEIVEGVTIMSIGQLTEAVGGLDPGMLGMLIGTSTEGVGKFEQALGGNMFRMGVLRCIEGAFLFAAGAAADLLGPDGSDIVIGYLEAASQ